MMNAPPPLTVDSPLKTVIRLLGTQNALAKILGVKQQTISLWMKKGRVPAEYVPFIAQAVQGKVTCHQLRPDLYPPDT